MKKQWIQFLVLMLLAAIAVLITSCQAAAAPYKYKGNPVDPPVSVPDFELRATDGSLFRLSSLEEKIALIFFGYTHCPDVCPLTVAKVRQALAGLDPADRERVQFIFISVDPDRDTPEVLADYLRNFDPGFIGLTDDFARVQTVMESYWAYAEKAETPELAADQPQAGHEHSESAADAAADSLPSYLVMHTGRVYLVTPQRQLLLMYPFEFNAEDLRSDLIYMLDQG